VESAGGNLPHEDQRYQLQNYRNIFALADALLHLSSGDDKAAEQLHQRIARTEPCTEKPWLKSVLAGK